MKENEMYQLLKLKVDNEMPDLLLQRIESGSVGVGIPDIFFRSIHEEGWIELKQLMLKRNKRIYVPFRPGQYPWIKRYVKLGGNMILLGTFKLNIHSIGWKKLWVTIKNEDIHESYSYKAFLDVAKLQHLKDIKFPKLLQKTSM